MSPTNPRTGQEVADRELGSVSKLIRGVRDGDEEAARKLWERYCEKLVEFARVRLENVPRRAADEEDVALSVFRRLCVVFKQGKYPQLTDRDGLWRLLMRITAGKAVSLIRYETAERRGSGRVWDESSLDGSGRGEHIDALDQVIGETPTPEFATMTAETLRDLLKRLESEGLKAVAMLKMQGDSNKEIAQALSCSLSTVDRRLSHIRVIWETEFQE